MLERLAPVSWESREMWRDLGRMGRQRYAGVHFGRRVGGCVIKEGICAVVFCEVGVEMCHVGWRVVIRLAGGKLGLERRCDERASLPFIPCRQNG